MAIAVSPSAPSAARRATCARRVAAATLVIIAVSIAACRNTDTPEARVRALIAGAVQAAEAGDAAGVRAAISPNYSDAEGRDRGALDGVIRLYLLRHRPLHLFTRIPTVEIIGNGRANAVVYAAMAASRVEALADVARLSASLYRFDLTLELEQGDWRVRSAVWRPAELSELH